MNLYQSSDGDIVCIIIL